MSLGGLFTEVQAELGIDPAELLDLMEEYGVWEVLEALFDALYGE